MEGVDRRDDWKMPAKQFHRLSSRYQRSAFHRTVQAFLKLSAFAVLLSSSSHGQTHKPTNCDSCWQFVDQGVIRVSAASRHLSFFVDSACHFSAFTHWAWGQQRDSGFKTVTAQEIDTLGKLSGHLVIDLRYSSGTDHFGTSGKVILVESSPGELQPVFSLFTERDGFYPDTSRLVSLDSSQILISKPRMGGQMTVYDERVWAWNNRCDCPCELRFASNEKELVTPLIGKPFKFSYQGSMEWERLYSLTYIELPGDHYRWPSGGVAWFQYELDSCTLRVIDFGYDSTVGAEH